MAADNMKNEWKRDVAGHIIGMASFFKSIMCTFMDKGNTWNKLN